MQPDSSQSPYSHLLEWPHPEARWIWSSEARPGETNARYQFAKSFSVDALSREWVVDIAVDSRYRLRINGSWVCDGPSRSYPESLFFDRVNISSFLRKGENIITVEATHFGVDTMQYIRGSAGLLLAIGEGHGAPVAVSDLSWKVSKVAGHRINTPRISSQFGFEEHLDLTAKTTSCYLAVLSDRQKEKPAVHLRELGMLSQDHRKFLRVAGRSQIREISRQWTIHSREHLGSFPGGVNVLGLAGMLGAELVAAEDDTLVLCLLGQIHGLYLDGVPVEATIDQDLRAYPLSLKAGVHWLSVGICGRYDHVFGLSIGTRGGAHTEFRSPIDRDSPNPWVSTGPLWRALKNSNCPLRLDGSIDPEVDTFAKDQPRLINLMTHLGECEKAASFLRASPNEIVPLPPEHIADADAYFSIRTDEENSGARSAEPLGNGPLELRSGQRVIVDMEDITNGYLEFEVDSEAPSVIDGYFFEHLETRRGKPHIQYLQNDGLSYRIAFRLTCPAGKSSFLSAQRRGFRYCMLTVRAGSKPVFINGLGAIESLYQPSQRAAFHSSDERLNAIFRMSQRTLHLCMEDTFTDCPSYEQVFWVGDARNEMLFAHVTFGAYDMSERCSRLVAQSLQTMPLPACQCPSGWNVIIPAFSFLWVISVWESYWQSGHRELLEEIYPSIKATLDTALSFRTVRDLYSTPTWNFIDWAPVDTEHATVLHNSLLLAGALDSGARMAMALGDAAQVEIYREAKAQLAQAANALWNPETPSYPDAIDDSGETSKKFSQHNSIFALLYDVIADKTQRAAAVDHCLHPPAGMTTVGSPFAMFFLLEILLKEGHAALVLDRLRAFWTQMLEADSPTCWEMVYPPGAPFPTRSYCHGWSAAPVYLLPYLLFDIQVLEAGWKSVRLSPRNLGLSFVEASVCTPLGMLKLWQKTDAQGQLTWGYDAPAGLNVLVESSAPKNSTTETHLTPLK